MEEHFYLYLRFEGFFFLSVFFLFFLYVTQTESFSSNFISLHKEIHEVYADSFERRAKEYFFSLSLIQRKKKSQIFSSFNFECPVCLSRTSLKKNLLFFFI